MPDDSPIPGRNAEEMALNGSVLSTVKNGGLIGALTSVRPYKTLPDCRFSHARAFGRDEPS